MNSFKQSFRTGCAGTLCWLLAVLPTSAATLYVWQDSPSPGPPFTNWATAAHTIQDAVDSATTGDEIVVTNGVYATGGRAVGTYLLGNRVAVDKAITVVSVNGAQFTTIQGAAAPGGGNGDGAIRCVYLANGATLSGFTLTNGHTRHTSSALEDRRGGGVWCITTNAIVTHCKLAGNSAWFGGGAYSGTLYNCVMTGNSASSLGGGADFSTLFNCTLIGNSASMFLGAGGAYHARLFNCIVYYNVDNYYNVVNYGGSTFSYSCTTPLPPGEGNIEAEPAFVDLAGDLRLLPSSPCIDAGTNLSALIANDFAGNPRPLDGNWDTIASFDIGAYEFTPWPIILAQPQSQTSFSGAAPVFSVVATGVPELAYQWRFNGNDLASATNRTLTLSAVTTNQAGSYAVVITNTAGSVTSVVATLTVLAVPPLITVMPQSQTVLTGRTATLTVEAEGSLPLAYQWLLEGVTLVGATNPSLVLSGLATNQTGAYSVIVSNQLGSATATALVQVLEGIYYVNHANPSPQSPFTSWETAATAIQDAIAAAIPEGLVRVTNGVYAPVELDKAITVTAVNGPGLTAIDGGGSNRCAWVGYSGVLMGFTLTNGFADNGGGAWCESGGLLTNCVLTGNSAFWSGGGAYGGILYNCTLTGNFATNDGGGAYASTLFNCILSGNSASWSGGGAYGGAVINCTLTGNSAQYGGGVAGRCGGPGGWRNPCTVFNSIVYHNTAPETPNYGDCATFAYSCTTPLPPGEGNIAVDPQLLPDLHLTPTSPCIGAGSSVYANGVDMDGQGWLDPACMGADQYYPTNRTGPLNVAILNFTLTGQGVPLDLRAQVQGWPQSYAWDFGQGFVLSNQIAVTHSWADSGTYTVRLTAWNDTHPSGVTATSLVQVLPVVHCVNPFNTTPEPPYTNWTTAASNIRDAIDAAEPGGVVLVTNGVYASVAIDKPIMVTSVNGPGLTAINGGGLDRCVSIGSNAILSGFTLTNGYAGYADGGGGAWCASTNAILTNCVLSGNSASGYGGGAYRGTLHNCTLTSNTTFGGGGGAYESTLYRCILTGNSAGYGGGVYGGTLNNCTLTGNSATDGGGAGGSILNNCFLSANSVLWDGGGASGGTLNNCTLTGNASYDGQGGGAAYCTLNNCIVYYNTAPVGPNFLEDQSSGPINYSCTTPMPANGTGNITNEPLLASLTRLSTNSPCIGAGNSAYTTGVDIDGDPWLSPPCMGADQVVPGQITGPLTVAIKPLFSALAGSNVTFHALVQGKPTGSVWDFGDGSSLVTNQPSPSHVWQLPGTYNVRLTAFNEDHPEGVTTTLPFRVFESFHDQVHYVNAASSTPLRPYLSWDTAARQIQEGVESAAQWGGRLVLVTNGVYRAGVENSGLSRIALTDGMVVRSVNGPDVTVIDGGGQVRCAYVGTNSLLSGFTLANGLGGQNSSWEQGWGGGVYSDGFGVVSNCILVGNRASSGGGASGGILINCTLTGNWATYGGGSRISTLYNCTLTGNSASYGGGGFESTLYNCTITGNSAFSGGGASGSRLYNCTVTGNSASWNERSVGGGVVGGTLFNCIVYANLAPSGANYFSDQWSPLLFEFSCTTPLPTNGVGNITNAPLFVDYANGNLRLQSNSPCINAGNNAAVATTTDLDGRARVADGTVDMGAYEFQPNAPGSFIAWLQQFGLFTDGSADFTDDDADHLNTWQEWQADTNPTNALSCLAVETITHGPPVSVLFQSSAARLYTLYACTNLTGAVWTPVPGQIDVPGTGAQQALTDPAPGPNRFYRVGVRMP